MSGCTGTIACAVLAAGGSQRLGSPKQLVLYEGQPLVRRAITTCAALGRVAVVLGAHRAEIAPVLGELEVVQLVNDDWSEGMASSIRVATAWAGDADALLLHLVDQPLIDAAHLARLAETWRTGAPLVGSRYDDVIGAPAIFDRRFYAELLALTGDRGAAPILRSHGETVGIAVTTGSIDVDTPEDVQRLASFSG